MGQNWYCPGDADDIMDGFGVVGACNGPPMTTRDKILIIRSFCKFSFTCKECDIHHRLSTHSCPVQKANILFMTRN